MGTVFRYGIKYSRNKHISVKRNLDAYFFQLAIFVLVKNIAEEFYIDNVTERTFTRGQPIRGRVNEISWLEKSKSTGYKKYW